MRVVDLFCGCGGMSLGFENAGYELVASYDNWDAALNVYRQNLKHPAHKADLMESGHAAEQISKLDPEMIIGGPPCQDYSSAGARDEDGGRAILTVKFAEIAAAVHPIWIVMENVSNIIKYSKVFEAFNILKHAGYGLSWTVLNAALCGVPQRRKRFFMVAKLDAEDGFFDAEFTKNIAGKEMTVEDYFGDALGIDAYYRHPRSYARRGVFSIKEPSPTIRGVNRPIPEGYKLHPNDPVSSLDNVRPLTTTERARIQTFPDNFQFIGSKTEIEQMIGNAVPVKLAEHVALSIKHYLSMSEHSIEGKLKKSL